MVSDQLLRLPRWATQLIIFLCLGLGFVLRWRYLGRMIFHEDEFISMLAIRMILEKGAPILPAETFYGIGLLYTYLGALTAFILQSTPETWRVLSLMQSMLVIPLGYVVAYKLFHQRRGALLVSLILTIHPLATLWAARVRMYTQTQLAVFALILVTWLAIQHPGQRRYLWLFPAILAFAILSHLAAMAVLPPLFVALIVVWWLQHRPPFFARTAIEGWLWPAQLLALALPVVLVVNRVGRFRLASLDYENIPLLTTLSAALREGHFLSEWYAYFWRVDHQPLTILAALGALGLLITLLKNRGRGQPIDLAGVFIYLSLGLMALELYLFIPAKTHHIRYNFMLILPFFVLSLGYSLYQLESWFIKSRPGTGRQMALSLFIALGLIAWYAPLQNNLLRAPEFYTYHFEAGFNDLEAEMVETDQVMSVHPAAAYLYGGGLDYYAKHDDPVLIPAANPGQFLDAYTGAAYLNTIDDLTAALNQPGRLWFVVDQIRLREHYEAEFTQQALHRLDVFSQHDNIWVFVEKAGGWPLPPTPQHVLDVDFGGQFRLVGYTSQLSGNQLYITLYWQTIAPQGDYKIFMQLRNQGDEVVAQADYLPYGRAVRMTQWNAFWDHSETIKTGEVMTLAPETVAGPWATYRLYIGLYQPETFERVPIINDTSGENAVILSEL